MKRIEVVAAVIVNNEKRILCAQKSGNGNDAYKWEFPGGKVEANESHSQALIREIKEELNLDIDVRSLIVETTHQTKKHIIVLKAFSATITGGKMIETVHHQIKWKRIENLKNLDWLDADWNILDDIISHLN